MKRFTMLKAVLCTLCLVMALSCSENKMNNATPEPISLNNNKIKVTNGVLVFSSQQEFDNALQVLTNKGTKSFNEWEALFTGFTSMRTAYDQITEQDIAKIGETKSLQGFENYVTFLEINGEREAIRVIASDAMATLFNKDGIVIIGEDAYKYKFEKILKVLKPTTADMITLASFDCKNLQSSVDELVLVRQVKGQTLSVKNGRPGGITNDYCISQYGGNRRLVGESNVTRTIGGGTFNSITCQAKHQRRLFGIWWAEAIPRIRLRMTSYLRNGDGFGSSGNVVLNPNGGERFNENIVSVDVPGCPCYGTIAYTADGDTGDGYKECSESESAY